MIIGDKARLAVECHLRHSRNPIIGDLWLWAGNLRIGDEISGVDLPLVMSNLSGPLYLSGRRNDEFIGKLDKKAVVTFFLNLVYGNIKTTPDELVRRGFRYYRHLVLASYNLEGFDSVFVVLLGMAGGKDRLIWKYKNSEDVHEQLLNQGEYETVILSCYDWLGEQTDCKSEWRTWLALAESGKDELRRAALEQHPSLGDADDPALLDQAAIAELERRSRLKE